MTAEAVSKRKSCAECVKAKRKCGMELPKCTRCTKKNIICAYPNSRNTINDMTFPELDFPWLDGLIRDSNLLPWEGELQPQIETASHSTVSGSSESESQSIAFTEPDYLAEKPIKGTMSRAETEAAVHRFRTWPEKWVLEGKAPFIHPRLYNTSMPRPLQDAYAACAIYSTKTEQNTFVAFTVIESKANELVRSPDQLSWTPLDLLAAVQALLIFQFIRLFDGDIRQRSLAEKAEPILSAWTEQLIEKTSEEQTYTTDTAPSWRSWTFAESVRRTVTMSTFLSGVYSQVKHGFCVHGSQVTANSFTAQRRLWEAQSALEWERAKKTHSPFWVSRMRFDHILQEARGEELDDFGMVLLITYKGQELVDHWMVTAQKTQNFIMDTNLHQSLADLVQAERFVTAS